MVNPGHRSRGCDRCRSLKRACDEARPSCGRCSKGRHQCAYNNEDVFQNMNTWCQTAVRRRVIPSQRKKREEHIPANSLFSWTQVVSVPKPMSVDWSGESINFFFDRFVAQPDEYETTWGFLPGLPAFYLDESSPTYLTEAVKADALTTMAQVSGISSLQKAASRAYQAALRSLRAAFGDPVVAASEEALISVMLLALYETVSGFQPPGSTFQSHFRGQSYLLRMHMARNTTPRKGQGVVAHTNRILLCQDLDQRRRPSLGLCTWNPGTHRSWLDEQTTRIGVLVTDICGRVKEAYDSHSGGPVDELNDVFIDCTYEILEIETEIDKTFEEAPSHWNGRTDSGDLIDDITMNGFLINTDLLDLPIPWYPIIGTYSPGLDTEFHPRQDTYPSHSICMLWNYIRYMRSQLLFTMYEIHCTAIEAGTTIDTPLTLDVLRAKLSMTIFNICSSTAYLVGNAADLTRSRKPTEPPNLKIGHIVIALWQLQKVYHSPGVSITVKTWIDRVFHKISETRDAQYALKLVGNYSH